MLNINFCVQRKHAWPRWCLLLVLLGLVGGQSLYAQTTRYESENSNRGNVTVASTYSGYSGSGYLTNFTSEWSYSSFEASYNQPTPVNIIIRYANGTNTTFTNLDLYQGSGKVADLSFPPTGGWDVWATLTVPITIQAGYQGVKIKGTTNVSQSAHIDYMERVIGGSTPTPPGSFTLSTPTNNANDITTNPTWTWSAASNADSYQLKVSTNSNLSSPIINASGISSTSYSSGTTLAEDTKYYWSITAVNTDGSTTASNANFSFTTETTGGGCTVGGSCDDGDACTTGDAYDSNCNCVGTFQDSDNDGICDANDTCNGNPSGQPCDDGDACTTNDTYDSNCNCTGTFQDSDNDGICDANDNCDNALIGQSCDDGNSNTSNDQYDSNCNCVGTPNNNNPPGQGTRFEAENANRGNVTTSSANGGYSASGYVTNITSEWSYVGFEDSYPENTPAIIHLRYANGTGSAVTHLNLFVGSQLVSNLTFPPTSGWTDWQTLSVNVTIPVGWQGVWLRSSANNSNSIQLDYFERETGGSVPAPPGNFSLIGPSNNSNDVGTTPNFSWSAASGANNYQLVVANNSNLNNPIINVSNLTGTSYTSGTALANSTTYYWKVTATNSDGSTMANNANYVFTTEAGAPSCTVGASCNDGDDCTVGDAYDSNCNCVGTFQDSDNDGICDADETCDGSLTGQACDDSNACTINDTYDSNCNCIGTFQDSDNDGICDANDNCDGNLAGQPCDDGNPNTDNDQYNSNCQCVGTFTPPANGTFYVSPSGVDAPGSGAQSNPYRTIAYAAQQVPANQGYTIYLLPGTFVETQAVQIPPGVNLIGAGESQVTVTANGPIPAPAGVDVSSGDWKLWYYGSLIQLYSAGYQGGPAVLYGAPTDMVPSTDGNQTVSGFTIDGASKQVKAGIWVQNRNNVTMNNVTVQNCDQRGAVFTRSDMWWYEPMPDGMWMYNTVVHDCEFYNNGAQLGSETLGNLCLAGLDGADIYNITIDDNVGYGIKFIMVGHYRNVKIHDCDITVNEADAQWGEKIAIELWNIDQGNEVYNIDCNTWHSYVNHPQLTQYDPPGTQASNLKIHNVTMIDTDGVSGKEAIEAALSGVEIYNCYFQDKGFGIAIWNGSGSSLKKNHIIRNNIITNVNRTPSFGFGNSSAIFIPDPAQNIKIYNNVFDRMGVALDLGSASGVDIKNNVFLFTEADDVKLGSGVTFENNLKYHTNPQKANFVLTGASVGPGNLTTNPGFTNSGDRATAYYQPASSASAVVDAGAPLGYPYNGNAPDIGRWEFGGAATNPPGSFTQTTPSNNASDVSTSPSLGWNFAPSASTYQVQVATNSNFSTIVRTQNSITSTNWTVSPALDNSTTYYWRVTAINSEGSTLASNAGISFDTEAPTPPPGSFSLSTPSGGSAGVSNSPAFSWTSSAYASTYTLVVSANSNFSNPVVNASNITGTSYTPPANLAYGTTYYWRVTANNNTGTANSNNNGLSFTTQDEPVVGQGQINRHVWEGVSGTSTNSLENNANYPNNPDQVGFLTSLDAPREQGSDYGQRIFGYLVPTVSGSYQFAIAGDDDSDLYLSTDAYAANKVKIAHLVGWTYPEKYDKYASQVSGAITLQAGQEYFIEILHKEANGGDHVTVAWKTPGSSDWVTVPGSVLSGSLSTPLPGPEAFSQSSPSGGANGVSRTPNFQWTASNLATSYNLTVSANSNMSNPVITANDLDGTSFTPTTLLQTSTTYYWTVTAVNEGGTLDATNAGASFTTEAQPFPGSFSQSSPASGDVGVSWNPILTWTSSADANSYNVTVSTNSNLSSPVINATGITTTSYSISSTLSANTTYYWRVRAVNNTGSVDATNDGISFTTGSSSSTYYVSPTGSDQTGTGSSSNPWKTLAYAATQVPANQNQTIFLQPGTFVETQVAEIPTGVNLIGSGEGISILQAGSLGNSAKEDYDGTLVQLISPSYVNDQYSPPVAPSNGNQTISGFTIDGNTKSLKAGIWLEARNNVNIHHVTIRNTALRGAVACFGVHGGQTEPPYYITGLTMADMTFENCGADIVGESLGNLCLGHTDGATISNITINDNIGYGIKFIFEGYYKNTTITNCNITVNEQDPLWDEDIAIELWNLGPGNVVSNVTANTWFSFVNWPNTFNNPPAPGAHLKVLDCTIIDQDGDSYKEGIELACAGTEVANCYIQDKGFGIAMWLQANTQHLIRNNIFYNTTPKATFTDGGAVFIVGDVAPISNVSIVNNVFDNLLTGGSSPLKNISVWKGTASDILIANNVTTNTPAATYDYYTYPAATATNVTYEHNLRDVSHNTFGSVTSSDNLVGAPGYKAFGQRWGTYYQPSSASSLLVNNGTNVGLPFSGSSPDIGKWEFGGTSNLMAGPTQPDVAASQEVSRTVVYPNPTADNLTILNKAGHPYTTVEIQNVTGQTLYQASITEQIRHEASLAHLPAGTYYLVVSNAEQRKVLRVIKR
ncbi:MAG: PA14 domain-containing protein [Bacteroidota bacterium]